MHGGGFKFHENLQNWQVLPSVSTRLPWLLCTHMKKTNKRAKQHRSFRRFVRKMFASILKLQTDSNDGGFEREVMRRLRHIENLIAREMVRRPKREK